MIEFRDNITALHLGAMLARAMGHRISLSPGQNFAFSFSLDDWGISIDDFDMIVEREHNMKGSHILVTFKRKLSGMELLAMDYNRVLADDQKIFVPGDKEQSALGLSTECPPGEHEWDEQPGEPPFDACIKCGAVRY